MPLDPDAGKDWRKEEKGITEEEMVGWHHWLNGHEFEQAPGVGDGQGGLACCSPWGHKESDMTEGLNWTELKNLAWRFRLTADYVLREFVIYVCHRYRYHCITDLGLFCKEIHPMEWSNLCRCWCFKILLKPLLKITLSIKNFLQYLGNKQPTKSSRFWWLFKRVIKIQKWDFASALRVYKRDY